MSVAGLGAPRLLVVLGGDEGSTPGSLGYHVTGNSDIFKLLPEGFKYEKLKLRWQTLRQNARPDLSRYDCVLNLVTDPDQHPRTLDAVGKLLRGYRGRVINRPEAVLRTTRDQVARRLAGIDGMRVPKAVRLRNPKPGAATAAARRAGLAFPLIVRLAGTHTGKIVGLARGENGLEAACAARGDFVLTEFVDYRSGDGLYRKYRFWSFGGRTIFRHLAVADEWNVHVALANRFMYDRPELIEEEVRLMARPEGDFPDLVHATFGAVRDRMGLDFFGLDFAFDAEGRLILFEANATMSFLPLVVDPRFSFRHKLRQPAEAALMAMLGLQD